MVGLEAFPICKPVRLLCCGINFICTSLKNCPTAILAGEMLTDVFAGSLHSNVGSGASLAAAGKDNPCLKGRHPMICSNAIPEALVALEALLPLQVSLIPPLQASSITQHIRFSRYLRKNHSLNSATQESIYHQNKASWKDGTV